MTLLFSTHLMFSIPSHAQWSALSTGTGKSFDNICFSSSNIGYALPVNGPVFRTLDAGLTWDSLPVLRLVSSFQFPNHIHFVDDSFGFISTFTGTNVRLYKTVDMGNAWMDISPANNLNGMIEVRFLNKKRGYAFANSSFDDKFWTTNDSGKTWMNIALGFSLGSGTSSIPTMFFVNDSTGYLSGGDGSFNYKGVIKRTSDYGKSWATTTFSTNTSITSMHFPNADTGFVISRDGCVFRTTNNGTSWDSLTTLLNMGTNSTLFFINGRRGYVIEGNKILGTTDGGVTWHSQYSGTNQILRAIFFTDLNTGYIAGDSGIILKTSNGGRPMGIRQISTIPLDIRVYPNPTLKQLSIEILNASFKINTFKIKIHDAIGGSVLEKPLIESTQLSLDLAVGIYFYSIENNNEIIKTGKLIIN